MKSKEKDNRIAFIKKIELFNGLDAQEIQTVSEHITPVSVAEGDNLFVENSPRESIFLISSGEVELLKNADGNREKRLCIFGPHDFLGEGSLTDDSPHSTSARAMTPVEIYTVEIGRAHV